TFKERCYQKMNEFKEQGKTIFFVSHALGQIKRFCTKVLWLEAGILQGYGPRIKILPQYRKFLRNFKSKSEEEKQAFREDIQNRGEHCRKMCSRLEQRYKLLSLKETTREKHGPRDTVNDGYCHSGR